MTALPNSPYSVDPLIGLLQDQPDVLSQYMAKTYGNPAAAAAEQKLQAGGAGGGNWLSNLFGGGQAGAADVANPITGMDKLGMGLDIFKTGFGVYNGMEANKLANKQFDFTKQAYQTNLANTTSAYNKQIDDDYNRASAFDASRAGTRADHMDKWGV